MTFLSLLESFADEKLVQVASGSGEIASTTAGNRSVSFFRSGEGNNDDKSSIAVDLLDLYDLCVANITARAGTVNDLNVYTEGLALLVPAYEMRTNFSMGAYDS